MTLAWLANTNQGRMVGDYISTSFAGGSDAAGVRFRERADQRRLRRGDLHLRHGGGRPGSRRDFPYGAQLAGPATLLGPPVPAAPVRRR
jgi:hypothetical protein